MYRRGMSRDLHTTAGKIEDLKNQIIQADGSVIPAFIPEARAYVLPFSESTAGDSQFTDGSTIADGLVAVYQRCVHLGCRVPWCNSSQGFECPCHGSKFDLAGRVFQGVPASANLVVPPYSFEGDNVLVIGVDAEAA